MLVKILLAIAFGLMWHIHVKLNKLQKAFETQGDINRVQKAAFDLLREDIKNDRVLTDETINALKGDLAKKANKRVAKKK